MYFHKNTSELSFANAPVVEERAYGSVCKFTAILTKPEVDSDLDIVEMKAWDGLDGKKNTPLLLNHEKGKQVGQWTEIRVKSGHVEGDGEIPMASDFGRHTGTLVLSGALTGVSVGFYVPNKKVNLVEKEMEVGGVRRKVRSIKKAVLFEASLTSFPALNSARIRKEMSLTATLKEAGYEQAEIERIVGEDDGDEDALAEVLFAKMDEMHHALSRPSNPADRLLGDLHDLAEMFKQMQESA